METPPYTTRLSGMRQQLCHYKNELGYELNRIISYWRDCVPDTLNGGFLGRIDTDNQAMPDAPKGSVLNARILWSFSAAYNHRPDSQVLIMAERAYAYLSNHLTDQEFGGVYWTVDHLGNGLDTKKTGLCQRFYNLCLM